MKNFKNIFGFTFFQAVKGKGFIILTVVMALLFFFAPALGMTAAEVLGGEEVKPEYSYNVSEVFVCDKLGGTPVSLEAFAVGTPFEGVKFTPAESTESAKSLSEKNNTSLILVIEKDEYGRVFNLVIPDGTRLTDGDTVAFADFLSQNAVALMLMKSSLTPEQLTEAVKMTEVILPDTDAGEALAMEIIEMIAPMLYAFLLYFMLIFYSQSVATSIVSEKHSKLMDTLLIVTKPVELVFGKMLAVSLAGISQLSVWLLSLVGGFMTGTAIVKSVNPETDMAVIKVFNSLSEVGSLFTPFGITVSVLFIVLGFLLYCALSAIGGAISEKPEDLSANNVLFTGIMAVSFLAVVFTGPLYTGKEAPAVLSYIPFTSILTVPTQLLLGNINAVQSFISLLIIVATTAVIGVIAGKLYKVFALYKGKFPGIKKAIMLLRSDKP